MNNVNHDIAEKLIQAGEVTKVNPLKEAALNVTMVENLKMKDNNVMSPEPAAAEAAPAVEQPVTEQPVEPAPVEAPAEQVPEQPAFDVPATPEAAPVAEQPAEPAPVEAPAEPVVDQPAFDVPVTQTPEQPVSNEPVAPAVEEPTTDLNTVETVATPEMTMESANVADIQPIEEQTPVDLMQPQSQISEATVAPVAEQPAEEKAPVINQVAGSPMEMPTLDDISERTEKIKKDFASGMDLLFNAYNERLKELEAKLNEAEAKYKDEETRRKMAEDRVEELTQKEVHTDNIINEVKNMRDELASQESAPVVEQAPVAEQPAFEAPAEPVVEQPVAPVAPEAPTNDAVEEFISGDNAPTEAPGARVLSTAAGAAEAAPTEPSPLDAFSPMETGEFGAVSDINPPAENPLDGMGTKTV